MGTNGDAMRVVLVVVVVGWPGRITLFVMMMPVVV